MPVPMKKRELGGYNSNFIAQYPVWTYYNGTTSLSNYHTNRYDRVDEWRLVGWNIPNFHAKKKRGDLIPMTPYYRFSRSGQCNGTFDVWQELGTKDRRFYVDGNYLPEFNPWIISEAQIKAYAPSTYDQYVQQAAAKVYANGHDTLTFLAELADVKHLFVNTAKKLLRMKFPNGKVREMTSEWLAYRYGWRTLMYDFKEINELCQNFDEKRTRFAERAGWKYSTSHTETWTTTNASGPREHTFMDTIEVGIRGNVVADVSIPKLQFNPLVTGWELIPFSFVIDWFFSVGKTLAALSFLSLLPSYTASAGFRVKVTRDYSQTKESWATNNPNEWRGTDEASGTCESEILVRTPCDIPLIPRFALNLDSFKVMDLIALIVQRLK